MSTSATKKRRGKNVEKFDSTKFVSKNAKNRYFDSVLKRNPIDERGLCVSSIDWIMKGRDALGLVLQGP